MEIWFLLWFFLKKQLEAILPNCKCGGSKCQNKWDHLDNHRFKIFQHNPDVWLSTAFAFAETWNLWETKCRRTHFIRGFYRWMKSFAMSFSRSDLFCSAFVGFRMMQIWPCKNDSTSFSTNNLLGLIPHAPEYHVQIWPLHFKPNCQPNEWVQRVMRMIRGLENKPYE